MKSEETSFLSLEKATRAEALARVAEYLAQGGVEDSRRDARTLLLAAAQIAHAELLLAPEERLDNESATRLLDYAARRLAREPISRILGARGFWTLDLMVAPDVLDPRADTETLVETTLSLVEDPAAPLRIVDLGSGSGAILCALLSELPQATGVAVDLSPAACAATRANLWRCGLSDRGHVMRGRWGSALAGGFDIIVSNPPYVRASELPDLDPEVRLHDPALALDGGADGLDCYREITSDLRRLLKPGGLVALEVGFDQAASVVELLRGQTLAIECIARDAAGHERVVAARAEPPQA